MRNVRRTTLTGLAIGIAIFVYTMMTSMTANTEHFIDQLQRSRLVIYNAASHVGVLPVSYESRIRSVRGVGSVCAALWFEGYYREKTAKVPVVGIEAGDFGAVFPDYGVSPLALEKFKRIKTAALVGVNAMHRFGWHLGDTVTLSGLTVPVSVSVTIVATIPKVMVDNVYIRLDFLSRAVWFAGDRINFYAVQPANGTDPGVLARDIDATFANSAFETMSEPEHDFVSQLWTQFSGIAQLLRLITVLVAIAVTLVAAGATAISVRERTVEVAVVRALGFQRRHLAAFLFGEILLVAGFGCVAAVLIGWAVIKLVIAPMIEVPSVLLTALPSLLVRSIAVATVVAFAASALPVFRALQITVMEGLRDIE